MKLPALVAALGYAGLLPFLVMPLWLTLLPQAMSAAVEAAWLHYVAMVTIFLAGTFWGFALPASEGLVGRAGMSLAAGFAALAWLALLLPPRAALLGLAAVLLLQWLADVFLQRALGGVAGYLRLRGVLTLGACVGVGWWLLLSH